MDVLLSLPNVESCSDIHILRKMLDVIETTSRNLRPHDIDPNHYGPILISVIMKKLPEEFRLELSRQMPVGKWDLAKLLEVFSKELASRVRCQSIKSSETSQNIGSQGLNSGSSYMLLLKITEVHVLKISVRESDITAVFKSFGK